MVEILQNRNAATRFQILVEMAAGGPNVPQKGIAARLGITPQAVSEHVRRLAAEEFIVATGRSRYKVSTRGVNWMLKTFRELQGYIAVVQQAVTNITVCAAIAGEDIKAGQAVGLEMRDGLLYATAEIRGQARGVAASGARQGEDIGLASIEGLVDFARGVVTVLPVPGIQKGGSRQVDGRRLKRYLARSQPVGAIGIEALAAMRRAGTEPRYQYGVPEAVIESAQCGLSFTVVCTEDALPDLLKKLDEEKLEYELIDLTRKP